MKNTLNILIASAAALSSSPLFAYNLTTDNTQISLSDALAGSTDNVTITGPSDRVLSNSWVYLDDNLSLPAKSFKVNQGAVFKAEGNYSFNIGVLTLSNGNEAPQGTSTAVFKGASDSELLRLTINNTGVSGVGNDTNVGSSLLKFDGNTVLDIDLVNRRFEIGYISGFKGSATMQVSGGNNTLSIYSFNLGFADATGKVALVMKDSGSTINANAAFRLIGGAGTSVDDIKGASLSYIADADGISVLKVLNPASAGAVVLTGVITLDLSDFIFTDTTGDFQLISTTNTYMLSAIDAWLSLIEGGSDLFAVYYKGAKMDSSDWTLSRGADGLWVSVSAIPEPSTYAAIFGALALAFAAYRRRK